MESGPRNYNRILFVLILLLGAFLIFFRLNRADTVSDDAHYSFRAIDYVDFLSSQNQTTPLQWFSKIPSWSRLSFHDTPPFALAVMHVFFRVLGVSDYVARLPSAFAGVISLVFLYLIAKDLYSKEVALFSMLALVLNSYFIWISRIAYLESIELACILGSLCFFIKSKTRPKYLYGWGICLGLAMITKYTSFYLLPVYALWILLYRRDVFKQSRRLTFIVSAGIVLLLCLPVIVYNFAMLRERGHFDMQFAILFNQSMLDWPFIQRQIAHGILRNSKDTIIILTSAISVPAMILSFGAFCFACYEFFRKKLREHWALIANVLFLFALFAFIAPTERYEPLFAPFVALSLGVGFASLLNQARQFQQASVGRIFAIAGSICCGVAFGLYQLIYTVNTNHVYRLGTISSQWYSSVRIENNGFHELDHYISGLLRDSRPSRPVSFIDYYHVPFILEHVARVTENEHLNEFTSLIVYDENVSWFGRFWALERWMKINYVPVFSLGNSLVQSLESRSKYQAAGVDSAYVILPLGKNVIPVDERRYEDLGTRLKAYLGEQNIQPTKLIRSPSGDDAFAVYFIKPFWETLDRVYGK